MHRATSINQENVFFDVITVLLVCLFFVTFIILVNFWLIHDIRISVYFLWVDALLLFNLESLLGSHEVRHDRDGNRLVTIRPFSNKANWFVNVVVSKNQDKIFVGNTRFVNIFRQSYVSLIAFFRGAHTNFMVDRCEARDSSLI